MEQYIIEIKSLLDEIKLDYYSRILPDDGKLNGVHIAAQFIVKLYRLTNKIYNRNNQPSTCNTCIVNNLNDLINYLLINDKDIITNIKVDVIEDKVVKKGKK